MFRIFSKYNALFIRPKIRGAIHEYQSQLLDRVKVDIENLFLKFTKSHSRDLTLIRDIPSVSGSIIWARSVELKLDGYMKNVGYVLGSGWEEYIQGQNLLQESLSFKRKLSTTQIFDKWKLTELERQSTTGFIFHLQKNRMEGNNFVIGVNFDESSINVFKEVRNLQYLGFQIPSQIQLQSKHSKKIYPVAVSLLESLRIYKKTLKKMHETNIGLLVGGYCITIQGLISKGVKIKWDDFLYEKPETMIFVREFATSIQQFEEKTQVASQKTLEVDLLINSLETCKYDSETFESTIQKIQRCVDRLQDERFSNLQLYCLQIDKKIEDMVRKRLTIALEEWNDGLVFDKMQIEPLVSSLKMRNFQISLDPPVEKSRGVFVEYLFKWISVVLGLPRIKVFKYLVKDGTYSSVLSLVDQTALKKAYLYIDKMINDVEAYVDKWLQYQVFFKLIVSVGFGSECCV
jgi:dynein heavy chain 1